MDLKNSSIKSLLRNKLANLEKRLPLEKFIPTAFLIFLLCVIILIVMTFNNIFQYHKDLNLIQHTNEVLKKMENIYSQILEIPSQRRGYLTTRDTRYLTEFDLMKQNLNSDFIKFQTLVNDNQSQVNLVKSMDTLTKKTIELLNSSIHIPLTDETRIFHTRIADTMQTNLEFIKMLKDQIVTNENVLLEKRNKEAEITDLFTNLILIATSIFCLIAIALSMFLSNKLIKHKNSAEKLLNDSYEQLEDILEEQTAELKESNIKLKEEILERKKISDTLSESEHRFRQMADTAPVLIWMSGKDKLCNYFNKGWLDFTGRTFEQELGNGWAEGVYPDDFDECLRIYTTAFDKREPFEMEYRLRTARGDYRYIMDKGIPLYEGTEFKGYIGSCIDIHQRKKNERFLTLQYEVSKIISSSKSKQEVIKEALKVICSSIEWNFGFFWMVSKEKDYISVDSTWSDDGTDKNVYSEFYDKDFKLKENKGLVGKVKSEGKSIWISNIEENDLFIRKEDAAKIGWRSVLGIPVLHETEVIAIIECFNKKNIAERKDLIEVLESVGRQLGVYIERINAEESLKNSYLQMEEKVKERTTELANTLNRLLKEIEEKEKIQNQIKLFAHAVRSIKECVYITDLENKTLFVNEAFELTYGFNEDEILDREIPVLKQLSNNPSLKNDIIKKSQSSGWKGELFTQRKDGISFPTFLSTSLIQNEDGKLNAIIGICQDISEIKAAEEVQKKRLNVVNVLNDVIKFTNKSFNLEQSIQYSINKICQHTNWDAGHCFLKKSDILRSTNIWNTNISDKYERFKKFTDDIVFARGEGTPGKTFETGKAFWCKIKDLLEDKSFKRAEITWDTGFKTGIWVPILKQNENIGVIEFFKKEEEEPDMEVLECIVNIGIELGSVAEKIEIIDKIKNSEKILNDAQHIAKLGSWEWDVKKNIVNWSEEMYAIYELTRENFSPTFEGFLERVHPDDKERVKKIIFDAYENKKAFEFYHRIVTPSGKEKFLRAQGEVFIDESGAIARMFGTGHDITDIRKAEENLRISEHKLRVAHQIARLGSFEWEPQEDKLYFSEEAQQIYEINADSEEVRSDVIKNLVIDEDKEVVEKLINTVFNDHIHPDIIVRIKTRSGNLKYIKSVGKVFTNRKNEVIKIIGTVMDITEIKLAEEELKRINEKLIETQKELIHNEKLAALGRFSSGIAHEIRNPLANISSLAQMVVNADIDEKNKKRLNYILKNSDIANQIIKNLLNFASPEDLICKYENLNVLLQNVIESSEARCTEKNIKIIKEVSPDIPPLYLDKFKLENAFMNFISNSIDAMDSGGTLSIKAYKIDSVNEVIIDFIDTGKGIPQENLDKILEPFFTTKHNGIGLGLGLAHQTIKLHRGTFLINSVVGKGTHIKLKLPITNFNNN